MSADHDPRAEDDPPRDGRDDEVADESAEESFPSSDPPSRGAPGI